MNQISNNRGGPPSNEFRLDRQNAKIWGVCSGIARHFDVDPMMVRIGFVAGALIFFGTTILIYAATALIAD